LQGFLINEKVFEAVTNHHGKVLENISSTGGRSV
jgi:hypothetical protein